jgi:peroxiredoxin
VSTNFKDSLKQLTFKTIYQGQVVIFGYDKLFADQRVVVLSLPPMYIDESISQCTQYRSEYQNLLTNGIDKVYVVNSYNAMISGFIDTMHQPLLGLPDIDRGLISALAQDVDSKKDIDYLSRRWEYVAIINNGCLEKFWQNPISETISLRHYRYGHRHLNWELHGKVQNLGSLHYRKLGPGVVLEYLKNSVNAEK